MRMTDTKKDERDELARMMDEFESKAGKIKTLPIFKFDPNGKPAVYNGRQVSK